MKFQSLLAVSIVASLSGVGCSTVGNTSSEELAKLNKEHPNNYFIKSELKKRGYTKKYVAPKVVGKDLTKVTPTNYQPKVTVMIKSMMKDPDSAKFRFLQPVKKLCYDKGNPYNAWAIPTYVNAKNSFGGYTGEKLYLAFVVNNDVSSIAFDNLLGSKVTKTLCIGIVK